MARNVPQGTTAATAAQATAPAPPPKPATATLPAPSKPAATASAAPRAAAPKAASAEEAEKARRRAAFETESKAAQEELGTDATAMRAKYLEAVGRIAETRRAGAAGQPTVMGGYYSAAVPGGYVAPVVSTPAAQAIRPDPKGRGEPLPAVRPSAVPQAPSAKELDVPMRAAERAAEIDAEYKAARAAYRAGELDIQRKKDDPEFPRSQFPELARQQRERLQRVADLAAARREYGLTD